MKFIYALYSIFAIISCSALELEDIQPSIVGGSPATLGQFPYSAAILFEKSGQVNICSGVLVRHKWVMTSAACLSQYVGWDVHVVLGSVNIGTGTKTWQGLASKQHIHPQFTSSSFTNNIALIYVDEMPESIMNTTSIKAIDLSTEEEVKTNLTGKDGNVCGYGLISQTATSSDAILYHITNKILPTNACEVVPIYVMNNSTICFDTTGDKSICAGDSGSPMVVEISPNRKVLVGLASYSIGACSIGIPAIFENVLYHREWIENTMNESSIITLSMSFFTFIVAITLKNIAQ